MKATDLIAALTARIAEVEGWAFKVTTRIDEDGDGKVVLEVSYDESNEFTDEPWAAFGDLPVEQDDGGMDNDQNGTVVQYVEWRVLEGEVNA